MANYTLSISKLPDGWRRLVGLVALLLVGLGIFPGRVRAQLPAWAEASLVATGNQFPFYASLSAVYPNGDVVLVGNFQGSVTFGTLPALTARGFSDVYVAKLDGQTHQWQWAVRGGGDGTNTNARVRPSRVVIDGAGDILIAGNYSYLAQFGNLPTLNGSTYNGAERALVVKLAGSTGNWLWATGSSGFSSFGTGIGSLALDAAGNAVVGGSFGQTAQFGSLPAVSATKVDYPVDAFVAGLAASTGQWQWIKPLPSPTGAATQTVAVDAAGNVTVAGFYEGALTLGSLPTLPNTSYRNIFVAKLNPTTGQWLWGTGVGGSTSANSSNYATSLACSPTGDVVVTGSVQSGTFQFGSLPAVAGPATYLARLAGGSGTWQWVKPAQHVGYATLAFDKAGDVVAAGTFTNTAQLGPAISLTSRGGQDIFVSKIDFASGQTVWATRAGSAGPDPENAQQVLPVSSGDIWLTGTFQKSLNFGTLPTLTATSPTADGSSIYLARLSLTQFALTAFTPFPNAVAATGAGPIIAVYTQPLAAAPTVRVFGDYQGYRAGALSLQGTQGISNNAFQFVPTQPFGPDELVSVTLAGATASAGGAPLPPRVYQFRAAVGGAGRGMFSGNDEITGPWQSALLAKGDLDNDGDLDIISAGPLGAGFTLGLNDGTGHFAAAAGFAVRGTVTALALADVDADGDLDVAWTAHYPDADSVLVRFNTGRGSFGGLSRVAVAANPGGLAFGDLDADGDLDLVASSQQAAGSVSVRFNDGTGLFTGTDTVSTGAATSGVAVGDVDNDGDLDLVATNEGAGTVAIALNDGTGRFGAVATVAAGTLPHALTLTDLNQDGNLDVVVSSAQTGASALTLGLNDGAGRFAINSFPVGLVDAFALADIDADGDVDLLTLDQGGRAVRTWLNGGAGVFYRSLVNTLSPTPATLVVGDLDGDGDVDWVTANGTGTLSPRFNTGVALATRPSQAALAVALYPNPAHQQVTLRLPPATAAVQLTLTNAVGQQVLARASVRPQADNTLTVDISSLPPGIYHLHILSDALNVVKALVVE